MYSGDQFTMYISDESPYCTPESNITLYSTTIKKLKVKNKSNRLLPSITQPIKVCSSKPWLIL